MELSLCCTLLTIWPANDPRDQGCTCILQYYWRHSSKFWSRGPQLQNLRLKRKLVIRLLCYSSWKVVKSSIFLRRKYADKWTPPHASDDQHRQLGASAMVGLGLRLACRSLDSETRRVSGRRRDTGTPVELISSVQPNYEESARCWVLKLCSCNMCKNMNYMQ